MAVWKLVVEKGVDDSDSRPAKPRAKASVELFNLKDDPYEKTNLADKNPEKLKELKAALVEFARQAVPPKTRPRARGLVVPKVWGEKD